MEPSGQQEIDACPECDLLLRRPLLSGQGRFRCGRCAAVVMGHLARGRAPLLACSTAAAIFYILANCYPALSLEGMLHAEATLAGAVRFLWLQGHESLAALVAGTTIIAPGLEISLILGICCSTRKEDRHGPVSSALSKLLYHIRQWQMLEVYLLAALVSYVKLHGLATATPGVGLYSIAILAVLLVAISGMLDAGALWQQPGGGYSRTNP